MKRPRSLEEVIRFVAAQNIEIGTDAQKRLLHYEQLIRTWSRRQNLISQGDRDHLAEHHFLPSFFLLSRLKAKSGQQLIDLGSGTGFPVVILAIMHPQLAVTAIDSSRKKCLFLREVDEQLDLGMQIVHQRVEIFNRNNTGVFDLVTSRALAGIDDLWNWSRPMLKPFGRMIVLKGGDVRREVELLEARRVRGKKYNVEPEWTEFAPYLTGKYLVELEMDNDPK